MENGGDDGGGGGGGQSPSDLMIGDVVYINGEGDWRGKVTFLGNVHFAKGEWAGVALDHPMGIIQL